MSFLRNHLRNADHRDADHRGAHHRAAHRRIGFFGRLPRSAIAASCEAELAVIAEHYSSAFDA